MPGPALSPSEQALLRHPSQRSEERSFLGVIEPIVIAIIEPSRQTCWRTSPKHRFQHTPVNQTLGRPITPILTVLEGGSYEEFLRKADA